MDETATGGTDWGTWAASMSDKLLGAAIDSKVNNPHEIEQLRINKLGALGYYSEGQVGAAGGLPPVFLLVGAALALYLIVKA